ncbi:hypothetical protein SGGMMB4_02431 [Sodalis glossinidius str. 'morsitans']|uniref:Uncharacterized protein n=1 Tax=Sodalis glossinidius (strain morsitans) TaxID=343509 RepID=A0A193QIQ1_SODGM|nr:hypothetical protein SGGMMB4_02431 [Sodalis glossinidius str. 'morsitans']
MLEAPDGTQVTLNSFKKLAADIAGKVDKSALEKKPIKLRSRVRLTRPHWTARPINLNLIKKLNRQRWRLKRINPLWEIILPKREGVSPVRCILMAKEKVVVSSVRRVCSIIPMPAGI